MALVAFGLGAARGHGAIARHERARTLVVDAGGWPSRCTLAGTVVRSPVSVGGGLRIEVDASEVRCRDGVPLSGRVTLHLPIDELNAGIRLARDDRVTATASLAPPYRFWNDGTGDPRPGSARRGSLLSGGAEDVLVVREGTGIGWAIDRARDHVRARIRATFPDETGTMARALVLGEDDLPEQDQRAFRQSGLAHLLAVSGMHLVLVVMGFVGGLRALLVRLPAIAARYDVARLASAAALPVTWMYAELAGASGSAVRAAWMCSVALLARALARRPLPWRALGLSLVAMSVVDPLVAFDVSFVLSALATAGLVGLARPIDGVMTKCWQGAVRAIARSRPTLSNVSLGLSSTLTGELAFRLLRLIQAPLATSAAATIACAPVLALMAPELPLSGLVANIVAVPIGEAAALPLCLVHALLSGWPAAEQGCALAASGALLLVRVIARAFTWGALPVPMPSAAQLATVTGATCGVALGRPRLALALGGVMLAALEIGARVRGSPHGVLRVTFLDVGQGDSALVDFPDGSSMLVDAGGLVGSPIDVGERAVAQLLAVRRRKTLDAVVLSHPHPDHFLGLDSALARVKPLALWDTGQGEAEGTGGGYARLLADMRARGVPVLRPSELCGTRAVGGAIVEVLAPCPGLVADRGANDNSFVVRIRFGERAILLMGDAEHEEESELVVRHASSGGLRADVLKVGHHGSRTSSSSAFLQAVGPRFAVISCGVRNRFGHPHEPTLVALERTGANVLRTDRHGSVVVTTDGRSLDVRTLAERASP
ncbi:MAG TPA: DNA internalization-related competence protein ComEC/Rec2 [Labilithrix sp.]|nr:DNA internalization-related competence protein ComEC/Rec2 [Labilithrix sp.]